MRASLIEWNQAFVTGLLLMVVLAHPVMLASKQKLIVTICIYRMPVPGLTAR